MHNRYINKHTPTLNSFNTDRMFLQTKSCRNQNTDVILGAIDVKEEIRLNKYITEAGICSRREGRPPDRIRKGLCGRQRAVLGMKDTKRSESTGWKKSNQR